MTKLLGIGLLVLGVYLLGQNIIFVTHASPYIWRDIPAGGSVLAIMGGVISLLFFQRITGNLGWILLGIGAVLVFLSGGIILKGTSLWEFFVAFVALAGGFQLITSGSIRF
ncbi:MAG: hypothetical protein PUP93_31760 [Rhizonema sp. NSF051]|nr:hypothetical protein [Rhizonema sp. NSF051]